MIYEYKGLEEFKRDLLEMEISNSLKKGFSVEYVVNMSIEDRNRFTGDLTGTKYVFRASLLPPHLIMDRIIGPNGVVVNFKTSD